MILFLTFFYPENYLLFSFSPKKNVLFCNQKNMKKIVPFLCFLLTVILFVSCSKSIVFDERVIFQDNNWAFENKEITFEASFKGSENIYAIIIELELIGAPNVDKMYTTFSMFTPNGAKTVKAFTFNFNSPKEPYIKGKSSNERIYRMTVYPKKYFSETGTYTFLVDQYSHKADNYGIRALRMYIEKVKGK
jgi:uncharacterized protein YxeA